MSTKKPPPKQSPIAQIKGIEAEASELINANLPGNYDFEIGKTVWRIRKTPNCKTVALQFPEGLLIFSTKIGDILKSLTSVDIIILGDITYGACCIDDTTASMLGADLLVHYGHSCLVPTSVANKLETIYVFVTIKINVPVATESVYKYVSRYLDTQKRGTIKLETESFRISLVSTIQFAGSLVAIKQALEAQLNDETSNKTVTVEIPRTKPLSSGEILGCTAPTVKADMIVYVGDGRFHLEAMMMANPEIHAVRYDPYNKTLTTEEFDHKSLSTSRSSRIREIREKVEQPDDDLRDSDPHRRRRVGLILGTLGRQGNPIPLSHIESRLLSCGYAPFTMLMSEVIPSKLELLKEVDAYVQFACPRLSIDWGESFVTPVLTSYEATLLCEKKSDGGEYSHPMDYYAYESRGPHTPNFITKQSV